MLSTTLPEEFGRQTFRRSLGWRQMMPCTRLTRPAIGSTPCWSIFFVWPLGVVINCDHCDERYTVFFSAKWHCFWQYYSCHRVKTVGTSWNITLQSLGIINAIGGCETKCWVQMKIGLLGWWGGCRGRWVEVCCRHDIFYVYAIDYIYMLYYIWYICYMFPKHINVSNIVHHDISREIRTGPRRTRTTQIHQTRRARLGGDYARSASRHGYQWGQRQRRQRRRPRPRSRDSRNSGRFSVVQC